MKPCPACDGKGLVPAGAAGANAAPRSPRGAAPAESGAARTLAAMTRLRPGAMS